MQVGATVLALAAGLALAGAAFLVAWRARARPLPRALALAADALGDAVLVVDPSGAIAFAGGAAGRITGIPAGRLEGLEAEKLLADDVAVLLRDARRGPAAGDVRLPGSGASRAARVAAAPLGGGRILVVLRPLAVARPPPLPVAMPPPVPARRAAAHADLAAAAAALRGPARRASTATALLRLQWPGGADGDLARLEEALGDLDRRLAALAAAGAGGAGHTAAVDVAAVAADVAAAPLPGGARVRTALAPARATCDEGRFRIALRELLRAAAAAQLGAPLELGVRCSGAHVLVEVAAGALPGEEVAGLARALLGPEGGDVCVEAVPGRAAVCRVSLPRCAPERPPAPGPGGSFDAERVGR